MKTDSDDTNNKKDMLTMVRKYRKILKPDIVRVEVVENTHKEDGEVLAPKEITDPVGEKPDDWVYDSVTILKPETVCVETGEEKIYEGFMLLALKEINPADKKPDDWVDGSMIDDPKDKKPE